MDILACPSLRESLFRLLCIKTGEKQNQRQLAKRLKVSPTAVGTIVKRLKKEGIVATERLGTMNLTLVELSRDPITTARKRCENLRMLSDAGLATHLQETYPGTTIVLFGSYARGEDTVRSDIDIAIIGAKKQIDTTVFEKLLERRVQIHLFADLKEIESHLRTNLYNGIVLHGAF